MILDDQSTARAADMEGQTCSAMKWDLKFSELIQINNACNTNSITRQLYSFTIVFTNHNTQSH